LETRHRRADDVGLHLHADRNWGRIGRRALGVVLVVAVAAPFAPTAGEARPTQEDPTSASNAQFSDSAIVDIPVDVAAGESTDVIGTLDDIKNNVARQLGDLEAADSAVDTAQAELDQADEAVTETETHIDGLVADSDDVVTNAYVNPPRDAILDTLAADSANEAAIKSALLSMQAEDDAELTRPAGPSRSSATPRPRSPPRPSRSGPRRRRSAPTSRPPRASRPTS